MKDGIQVYLKSQEDAIGLVQQSIQGKEFCTNLLFNLCLTRMFYALSFYRSQNVLGWSKFFVPDKEFIYILWQSQTFCARQKDDLHSVKLVFVLAQKFLRRH